MVILSLWLWRSNVFSWNMQFETLLALIKFYRSKLIFIPVKTVNLQQLLDDWVFEEESIDVEWVWTFTSCVICRCRRKLLWHIQHSRDCKRCCARQLMLSECFTLVHDSHSLVYNIRLVCAQQVHFFLWKSCWGLLSEQVHDILLVLIHFVIFLHLQHTWTNEQKKF